jgi:hypothetical protein
MNVLLSPKHGVNPSLDLCYYCLETKGIALLGHIKDDAEAPRQGIFDRVPCDKCADLMRQGVMCISVRDGETDMENPYRTGKIAVIKDEAIERMNDKKLVSDILKRRCVFIEDEVWASLGLPSAENLQKAG